MNIFELIAVFDIFEVSWYFAVPVGRGDWTEDLWVFVPKSGGLLEGEQEDLTSGDKVKFGSLQGILGLEDISKTGNWSDSMYKSFKY
jgi:hypothetical protein